MRVFVCGGCNKNKGKEKSLDNPKKMKLAQQLQICRQIVNGFCHSHLGITFNFLSTQPNVIKYRTK